MEGTLQITLTDIDGRTRPAHVVAAPPMQCSRVRYDDPLRPEMACLTMVHMGGVLQGDQLRIAVRAEPGAQGRLTAAAATQVYRMPEHSAQIETVLEVCAGAQLEYLPEPLILFADARLEQRTSIVLHPEARLALREIVVAGRLARGEVHRYQRFASAFTVADAAGHTLLSERGLLEPTQRDPAAVGVQGGHPVMGSLYLLRLAASPSDLEHAWNAIEAHSDEGVLAAAGALPGRCGTLVRALGPSAPRVRALLDKVLLMIGPHPLAPSPARGRGG